MTIHQSDYAKGAKSQPYPLGAGVVVACRMTFTVPTDIAENDIIEFGSLPSGCVPVDVIADSDDLDSGTPAIVWDFGLMSGEPGDTESARTCGDEFFDGTTISQGGGVARTTEKDALRIAASGSERSVGAKLVTDAATAVEGVLGLTLFYMAP
jgi:hypothetical protein